MSTSSAVTRPPALPYTVILHATNVRTEPHGYVVGVRPYVDLHLTAEQRHTLTDVAARMKLNAAALLERILIIVGGVAGFAGAVTSSTYANYPALAGWIVGGGVIACTGLALNRHVRAGKARIEALVAELIVAGALAPEPLEEAKVRDLQRIQSVLGLLRKRGVTDQDWRFQAAAEKVVEQDRHRPTLKHIAIAESDGADPATRKIRKLVKGQRRAWAADIAEAEIAVEELRDLVGQALRAPVKA